MDAWFNTLDRAFFARATNIVSKQLLGKVLCFNGKIGVITETESYIGTDDPACHAAKGKTNRTAVMFGPPGFSYVYLIYGIHHCLNFVTEQEGFPAAVLIRGIQLISEPYLNLNGPGKLCGFFKITKEHNNCDIINNKQFYVGDIGLQLAFTNTSRIGITKGIDKLWRYVSTHSTEQVVKIYHDTFNKA